MFFFCKHETAYDMRISDCSSDVCSSDLSVLAQDVKEGESIFKTDCVSCHAINRDLIGPALKGVSDRHDEAWLIKWIRNSQALIASGDQTAIELFEDRKSVVKGKSELVRVNLGGRCTIKKTNKKKK